MVREDIFVVVMAHKARSDYFTYLRRKLGDVPFSVDDGEKKLGTWGNRKQALLMVDKTKPYVLVVQDDAIICEDFYNLAVKFISQHIGPLYQFFVGRIERVTSRSKGDYIEAPLYWGVAICVATDLIEPMIEYCDKMARSVPDDMRMQRFFERRRIKCLYPDPCLVSHRNATSLVGNMHKAGLQPYRFIDEVTE